MRRAAVGALLLLLAVGCGLPGRAAAAGADWRYVEARGGRTWFVDAASLRFFVAADGTEVAAVRARCAVDAAGRAALIEARAGLEEPVAGLERLAYFERLVWFKLPRDKSGLPVRMAGASEYYDADGAIIYMEGDRRTWRGGRWFTLPGYEQVFVAALLLRHGRAAQPAAEGGGR